MTALMYGLDQPHAPGTVRAEAACWAPAAPRPRCASCSTAASTLSDICAAPVLTSSDAVRADRRGDVRAVGHEHVDVALHRQHVHLAVARALIGDPLRRRRSAERDDGHRQAVDASPVAVRASRGTPG